MLSSETNPYVRFTVEIVTIESILFIELSLEGINKTSIRVMMTWKTQFFILEHLHEHVSKKGKAKNVP